MLKNLTLLALFFTTQLLGQSTNGLVAHYPFDNANANDQIASRHGVVHGATPAVDRFGNPNGCYSFDGQNDYIEVASPNHNFSQTTTISLWVNLDTLAANRNHMMIDTRNGSFSFPSSVSWLDLANEQVEFGVTAGVIQYQNSNWNWRGNWTHLVMIIDTATQERILYVNNQKESNVANNTPFVNPVYGGDPFTIGSRADLDLLNFFHGKIDDVRIYNRTLDSTEVTALYNEPDPSLNTTVMDNNWKNVLSCYPNPSHGLVTIESDLTITGIDVYDMLGNKLWTITSSTNQVDLSALPIGVYMIVISTNKGKLFKELIKQ